jgi:hypothetical protein
MQSIYINLLHYDAEFVAIAQRVANLKIPAQLIGGESETKLRDGGVHPGAMIL